MRRTRCQPAFWKYPQPTVCQYYVPLTVAGFILLSQWSTAVVWRRLWVRQAKPKTKILKKLLITPAVFLGIGSVQLILFRSGGMLNCWPSILACTNPNCQRTHCTSWKEEGKFPSVCGPMHQSFETSTPWACQLGHFTQCECESQWSSQTRGQKYWVNSLPLGTPLYKP